MHQTPRAHVTTKQTPNGDFHAAPWITDALLNLVPHNSDRAPGDPATRQRRPRPLTAHTGHVHATIPDLDASVRIFIKPAGERTFIMETSRSTTIAQLKPAIDKRTAIPSAQQVLSNTLREFADFRDFAHYEVADNDAI